MQTDIVLRLEAEAELNPLFSEAAHEIDRLRTALHEIAFRAIDKVSETTPYKIRKKYSKDAKNQLSATPPNEDARDKERAKARAKRAKDRDECTDRHIKLMLSRHGKIRYSEVTPELVQLKRDQIEAEQLSRRLNQSAINQTGNTE